MRIVSTGGTRDHLQKKGFAVTDIQELTGFPSVFSGRVKSLHPFIYMPLLARQHVKEDQALLREKNLTPFDLLICNFYPFERRRDLTDEKELLEWIDVGGPSLLRAAAKNFFSVTALCSPEDYPKAQKGASLKLRRSLAAKAFAHISRYDCLIAEELLRRFPQKETPAWPKMREEALNEQSGEQEIPDSAGAWASSLALAPGAKAGAAPAQHEEAAGGRLMAQIPPLPLYPLKLANKPLKNQAIKNKLEEKRALFIHQRLRYGENPGQEGLWLRFQSEGLHQAEILQGKRLSFNNLLDLQAAALLIRDLAPEPSAALFKHGNVCGMASGKNIAHAFSRALSTDPVSAFGCAAAFSEKAAKEAALALKDLFVECAIAPDWDPEALEILKDKKNMRILKWPGLLSFRSRQDIRSVDGGFLAQDTLKPFKTDSWRFLGKKPSAKIQKDLLFALKAAASLKSNSAAIVQDQMALGLGMGQVNRVDSVRLAVRRAQAFHPNKTRGLVLASDGFFPFPDSIELLKGSGVEWALQPGGSIRDRQVAEKARQLKINMVMTGTRVFRH